VIKVDENGRMSIIGLHLGNIEDESKEHEKDITNSNKGNLTRLINKMMINKLVRFSSVLKGDMLRVVEDGQ